MLGVSCVKKGHRVQYGGDFRAMIFALIQGFSITPIFLNNIVFVLVDGASETD